jgi:outer membrane protein assembly factor BamB
MTSKRTAAAVALAGGVILAASSAAVRGDGAAMAGTTDWPMWGGTPSRNMVSAAKGLPDKWDVKAKTNVKWVSDLGSQTYGNTTVAGGKVFVGTNNELLRDKQQIGDRGVLMAFKQDTGEFLWQITHEKVAAGRVNDWPFQGIASSPLVEGDKIYYVSNRGEVMCLDTEGFRDNNENDGPVMDEKFKTPNDADVVWKFDMMEGSAPSRTTCRTRRRSCTAT